MTRMRGWLGLLVFTVGCKGSAGSNPPPPPDAGTPPAAPPPQPSCSADDPDWPMYGHDVCNTRMAGGDGGLSADNAEKLALKWTFTAAGDISATPAVVAGNLYVPDWGGMMHRIDTATGKAVWSKSVASLAGLTLPDGGAPPDTVVSRITPIVTANALIFGTSRTSFNAFTPLAYMAAVDPDSGALLWSTLVDPHPGAVVTGSPVLENGKIYVGVASVEEALSQSPLYTCCSFRGSVVALDAATGAVVWKTSMIDDATFFAADGGPSGYTGASIWSGTPTIDRKRGQLYVTTGNNYTMPDGVDAAAPGDHVESILALDLGTGAIKWSRAVTTDDVWTFGNQQGPDFDFGCGANLYTVTIDGGTRDLVGAGQKSGIYWALDADTGALVWKSQVGPGGHLGGIHWGTATDGARIYFGVNDESGAAYPLGGVGGEMVTVGSWGALDPATGTVLWQVANPALTMPLGGASVNGPLTVVGGVVLAGSMDAQGMMYALSAKSGDVLWSFASGATVYGGPAVARGVVYWGSGYPGARLGFGSESNKLYAFGVGP